MEWVTDPQSWVALLTLTVLEIVLGIDNIIFISILVGRLPPERRDLARRLGLTLAMGTRILLLLSLAWVMGLKETLFTVLGQNISGRDLVLFGGGLFLLWKSANEIHHSLENSEDEGHRGGAVSFGGILAQIAIIDIVFSLDSVITAVGLVEYVSIMITAIVASVAIMMYAAKPIGDFVDRHPTIKMLALSFLTMVGMVLVAEAFDFHVPKGYVYFAMAFSMVVELLNIRMRAKRAAPVRLHKSMEEEDPS